MLSGGWARGRESGPLGIIQVGKIKPALSAFTAWNQGFDFWMSGTTFKALHT